MIKTITQKIIPNKVIRNSKYDLMKLIDNKYIIEEFEIHINDETKKIESLKIIRGTHPNCDPKSKVFCMPKIFKEHELSSEVLDHIIEMIKTFNFDSAYIKPWFSYELINLQKKENL